MHRASLFFPGGLSRSLVYRLVVFSPPPLGRRGPVPLCGRGLASTSGPRCPGLMFVLSCNGPTDLRVPMRVPNRGSCCGGCPPATAATARLRAPAIAVVSVPRRASFNSRADRCLNLYCSPYPGVPVAPFLFPFGSLLVQVCPWVLGEWGAPFGKLMAAARSQTVAGSALVLRWHGTALLLLLLLTTTNYY